jgi:hypothetical protein
MKENAAAPIQKEASPAAEPREECQIASQVRIEFERYLEKREAARRHLGKVRRTTLLEELLS